MRVSGSGATSPRGWTVVCLGLLVALASADLGLGEDRNFSGTLAVPAFMAGALLSPRRTALIGALAVTCALVLVLLDSVPGVVAPIRVGAVLLAALLAPWVAGVREAREARLVKMTRVAEVAQKAVLAPLPAITGPLAVASAYRSASDEASIGGDLIDLVETAEGARLVVGDVRGKGLAAVHLAASTLRSFRDAALTTATLPDAVQAIERRIARDLGEEDFVTAALASVSTAGLLELANCAHPPPLLVGPGGVRRLLEPAEPALPLGLGAAPVVQRVQLRPGDRVLFYTDGLVEARSADGSFVALDEVTGTLADAPFEAALDEVVARLRAAVGGRLTDDLALLLIEYAPAPVPSRREVATVRSGTRSSVNPERAAAGPSAT
ncbi:PP2C family protein-serine/threonine phosphatase [Motilibacter deserti]|uniref:Serine/threonine-protein phosphatase n=1 Tax=Motilibacter deserti TaxID=2714956 RepID=A0ABX0GZQ4_9ACTN|nr:PP2C family protein-serine/threonine phosphatase [Motilibacter deserti]NHC16075.1 serine/threonine-protein phosphatase [Motilibacter deserti]